MHYKVTQLPGPVLEEGNVITADLGGTAPTPEMAAAIIEKMPPAEAEA